MRKVDQFWGLAGIYALLTLVLGGGLLLPGHSLFRWDTLLYTWPVALETRAQWLSGHWPFWASSFCCGTPLLANINAGVLYPPRLLIWFLPLQAGYHLFVLFHLWLSLFGMHLFLRRGLKLRVVAAAVGAVAFGASGYARGMWDTHNFVALPWIPLGFACLLAAGRGALESDGSRDARRPISLNTIHGRARVPASRLCAILGMAGCWSMMILGGDFQAACLWLPAAALLELCMEPRGKLLGPLLAAVVLSLLLTAPQWIPTVVAEHASYRAGGVVYAEAVERSWNPVRILELFVPHAFGNRELWFGDALATPGSVRRFPWVSSMHIGRLAMGLALLAWGARRQAAVRWAALVAGAGGVLSLGGFLPGFGALLALPVLGGFRYPEKYGLWMTVGLAVLAAVGAERLLTLQGESCRGVASDARSLPGLNADGRRQAAPLLLVVVWFIVLVAMTAIAAAARHALIPAALQSTFGSRDLWLALGATGVATAIALGVGRGNSKRWALALMTVVLFDCGQAWFVERPTMTGGDSLATPLVAEAIRNSESPQGRVLRDPALQGAPQPEGLSNYERSTLLESAVLDHNSPRLWGMRSSAGFSPLEAAPMRNLRLATSAPVDGSVPPVEGFVSFCKTSGTEWLITTPPRAMAFAQAGLPGEITATWGPADSGLALYHVTDASEAVCDPPTVIRGLHRFRPGVLRVDMEPGAATTLHIRESFAAGWRARDQSDRPLKLRASADGLIDIQLPAGVRQVRLQYVPAGWELGCGLAGLGAILAGWLAYIGSRKLAQAASRSSALHAMENDIGDGGPSAARPSAFPPFLATIFCAILAIGVGTAARGHWSCAFDEGFHLARGLAKVETGDARLSYFHPPLQNMLCGYFAKLAYGDRLRMPTDVGWEGADIWSYATRLAEVNADIYPELVRASRCGSLLLTLLVIIAGMWWAGRMGGTCAQWLAGIGLALHPALLAHGNLTTTDVGVTAFVLCGMALFWLATRTLSGDRNLTWATLAFVVAAMTKHTGLIWLASYLLLAIPCLAVARRSWRPLAQIPLGLVLFGACLLILYGPAPQLIRAPEGHWLHGRNLIAGRYFEGLISQGQHTLEGHRTFFHGVRSMQAAWWLAPVTFALKSPTPWVLAALAGVVCACRRGNNWQGWILWIPVAVFGGLLVFVNKLGLGVRHLLPLVALATIAAAVWAARIRSGRWRRLVSAGLVLSAVASAGLAYPDYLAYYPAVAGGVRGGDRWMVDSSYDWGQDLEELEQQWADLTDANHGNPPQLLYHGFVDPRLIYGMPVMEPSLCGFMQRAQVASGGPVAEAAWVGQFTNLQSVVVGSISALNLDPFGIDMSRVRSAREIGRIGNSYRVMDVK